MSVPTGASRTLTDRQTKAISEALARARSRYRLHVPDWRDGYPWLNDFREEIRPGRGRDLHAVYADGDRLVYISCDVYGRCALSVADLDWVHADDNEDCDCRWCEQERSGADA